MELNTCRFTAELGLSDGSTKAVPLPKTSATTISDIYLTPVLPGQAHTEYSVPHTGVALQ